MLRTSWIALGIVGLVGLSAQASAQEIVGQPSPYPIAGPIADGTIIGTPSPVIGDGVIVGSPMGGAIEGTIIGSPSPIYLGGPSTSQSGPIHPYSYYIDFPNPARTYVPYGPSDTFTYQGQAYGHAYDRWTWSAMSGASPGLGRYYQILH
ncbi:hypothetical protein [Paludisphaera mucosa]|uniref:Uncharacterized protein n=1 Tax=Paludisphaera mucosa TaxID=3030827 RepID=A0ABT6FJV7_9BACT|nr:hypothetical protein [Paludisphaera mucosa]MDG3007867.1 hypothetical protein [Paludisphaera mucosa]